MPFKPLSSETKERLFYTQYYNSAATATKHTAHQIGIVRLVAGAKFWCEGFIVVEVAISPRTSEGWRLIVAAVVIVAAGALVAPQAT